VERSSWRADSAAAWLCSRVSFLIRCAA
jgi:hypothetical protein